MYTPQLVLRDSLGIIKDAPTAMGFIADLGIIKDALTALVYQIPSRGCDVICHHG
jgi:hypothetical protein